jgi:hypothetical protein
LFLLDEISWLGGLDQDFPGHLKMAWDSVFKQHPKLILVLCGSVSAWITKNILNNTGFLGRLAECLRKTGGLVRHGRGPEIPRGIGSSTFSGRDPAIASEGYFDFLIPFDQLLHKQ